LKTHSPEPVPFALMKSSELKTSGQIARRYTEAEGTKTGLVVGDGYHLIESLFGRELNRISD
jgi:2,3-bisphosphoglycerate-independent phosphoglycerate mutase